MSTITDFLAKFRSVLNEASAGFFADSTDLYPYLDMGQNRAYQELLRNQKNIKQSFNPLYESEALKSLLSSSDILSGTKASKGIVYTNPTGTLTFTAVDSGTGGNSIRIMDGSTSSGVVVTCTYVSSWTILIQWATGQTCQQIIDAVNNHAIASKIVLATTDTPTVQIANNTTKNTLLSNGTGDSAFIIPSDLLEIHSIELTNGTVTLPITYLPLWDFRKRTGNSYTGHNYNSTTHTGEVLCTMNTGTTLITSFTTWDTYWTYLRVYYYKKPLTVSSSQGFTLPAQCYESILHFALYYALSKAKISGSENLQQAIQLIQGL